MIVISLSVVFAVVVTAVFAGGWYFAGVLEEDGLKIDHTEDPFELTVTSISPGTPSLMTITYPPDDEGAAEDLRRYARWGLESETAFAALGALVGETGSSVTREYRVVSGQFAPGDAVRLERSTVPGPESLTGVEFEVITIDGPLGPLPAWLITPDGTASSPEKWAVLVHGRTASGDETLRSLPAFVDAGFTTLVISYRNDEDTAPDPSGYYQYGLTEWEDVEPAVAYALANGASTLVLGGFSMGGGIVASFMIRSDLAAEVDALFLNAPMLDFGRTVDLGAKNRGAPGIITWTAKLISSLRYGVDWGGLNFLADADRMAVPTLLIHGDEDSTVPVETSRELAGRLPGNVSYEEFPGADHVASWNSDPVRYETALRIFLEAR